MLIGELSRRTGVPAHLLRYYEAQGLLAPGRGAGGYREYADEAVVTVTQIRKLLEAGLSTQDIGFLLPCVTGTAPELEPCPELLDTLRARRDELDDRIGTLARSRGLLDDYITATERRERYGRRMPYDIARVRATYPALAEGFAHLDGAAGTQAAGPVIDAVAGTLRRAVANRSVAFEPGRRATEIVTAAREAVADLVGGVPGGVVLGPSATALTYVVARTLAQSWRPGDEVVVSRLDHDANVRPWVQAAEGAGAIVRWAEFDPDSGDLPAKQYAELVGPRTRVVAVTAASNVTGAMPRVREIADLAHAAGALVYVDGVHATAHVPTDVRELGADFYVTSAYKWSGPHLAAVIADPARWESLRPAKLIPSSDAVPERFEFGTPSFELLAGVVAAVEHLAALTELSGGTVEPGAGRRARLVAGLTTAAAYEAELLDRLLTGLAANPDVTVLPAPAERCPTVSFRLRDRSPAETAQALGDQGICVFAGDYYAYEYFTAAGLRDSGGAVRASIYHYTTTEEIDRLLAALTRLG